MTVRKIQEKPVRVVRLTAECTCGGQYQFRHKLLNGDLVHLCTHCDQTEKLEARYPRLIYVDEDQYT